MQNTVEIQLSEQALENTEETFKTLNDALVDIIRSTEADFEGLKSQEWYDRLWKLITFSKDNQKMLANDVSSLAKLNDIVMKALQILAKKNKQTADKVLQCCEQITRVTDSVEKSQDLIKKIISNIIRIKRGFDKYKNLDELSEDKREIIENAFFSFAKDINTTNEYTEKFAQIIKQHDFNSSLDYRVVDSLSFDVSYVLYELLQGYAFLAIGEFNLEDNIFKHINLSLVVREKIESNINDNIKILGKDGFIEMFSTKASENNTIDDDEITLISISGDEEKDACEKTIDNNYCVNLDNIKAFIVKFVDEGVFGKKIYSDGNSKKEKDILSKKEFCRVAKDSIISITQMKKLKYLFTYCAVYVISEDHISRIQYSEISKNDFSYKLNSITYKEKTIFYADKLSEFTKFLEIKDRCEFFPKTDKFILINEADDEIKALYLSIVYYISMKSCNAESEVFRKTCDYGIMNRWNQIKNSLNNDDEFTFAIHALKSIIPYSSSCTIMPRMVVDICQIVQYSTNKNEINPCSEQYFLKMFDFSESSEYALREQAYYDKNLIQSKIIISKGKKIITGWLEKYNFQGASFLWGFIPGTISLLGITVVLALFDQSTSEDMKSYQKRISKDITKSYKRAINVASNFNEIEIKETLGKKNNYLQKFIDNQ